jgi:hypothetical protein
LNGGSDGERGASRLARASLWGAVKRAATEKSKTENYHVWQSIPTDKDTVDLRENELGACSKKPDRGPIRLVE